MKISASAAAALLATTVVVDGFSARSVRCVCERHEREGGEGGEKEGAGQRERERCHGRVMVVVTVIM